MGALHPVEQFLTLLLAFGPFVLLAVVLWLRRGDDEEPSEQGERVADPAESAEDRTEV